MKILIDNGHGSDTKGKRSPDGTFLEWAFAREIAMGIKQQLDNPTLQQMGHEVELIVPEQIDISLQERVKRVNKICKEADGNVVLISIHANAAGDGSKWMTARGWECHTSPGQTNSDLLAECLYFHARQIFKGMKIREDKSDGDADKESNLYILKKTICPAVLTENFFQDNEDDVKYLLSNKGKEQIIECHVKGILSYLSSFLKI